MQQAPLPPGWEFAYDQQGRPYYFNRSTGQNQYEHPAGQQLAPAPPQQQHQMKNVSMQPVGQQQASSQQQNSHSNDKDGARAALSSGDTPAYKDVGYAIGFVVHLVIMFAIGLAQLNASSGEAQAGGGSNSMPSNIYTILGICIMLAAFQSAAWLSFFKCCPGTLIWTCFFLICLMILFFAVSLMMSGSAFGIVVGLLALVFLYCYIRAAIPRIPLAKLFLAFAGKFIQQQPSMIGYEVCALVFTILWLVFWSFSLSASASWGMMVLYVLSLFWTCEVIKNVVHVTCSGTLAAWYFQVDQGAGANPTSKAFRRAVSTSFGSICLGSLLIAVVRTLKWIVNECRKREGNAVLLCIAACILSCIESWMDLINEYAFTQVAIFGKGYWQAAQDTFDLMFGASGQGMNLIMNDNLTDTVLLFAKLISGLFTGCIAALWSYHSMPNTDHAVMCFFMGFGIGFVIVALTMEVANSVIAAMFVCQCYEPDMLLQHPDPETQNLGRAINERKEALAQRI